MSEGTNAVDSSGSESLEDFVGSAFGDIGSPSSSSEPGEAPGTPPAAPAPPVAVEGPEGAKPDAHAGTPPGDAAAKPVPDPAAPVTPPGNDDLLASAKSATYTVDGVEKTYEGIKVLGTDGAIIAAADLPDVMTRLGERDRLVAVNQQQYRTAKALEPLTTWTQTGADGKEETLTGSQGLVELRVDHARQSALLTEIETRMTDPAQLLELLAKDGQGNIVIDPRAWKMFLLEAKDAALSAMATTRAKLGTQVAEASKPTPQPINYAAEAPAIIRTAAGSDYALLSPADHAFLTGQLEAYTRGTIVHANYAALVKDRIAQRQEQAKTGRVVTSAAAENAAKLAAAARGVKPGTPAKPIPAAAPPNARAQDSDSAWDLMQNLAGKRLRTG